MPYPAYPSPPPTRHASPPAEDMRPRYRALLGERLEGVAPSFKMTDVAVKSFQLQASALSSLAGTAWKRETPHPTRPLLTHTHTYARAH